MSEAAWKATERRIAELLGGRRVPVSGRGRGDQPDIRHPYLSLEVKHRKTLPDWIKDALRQALASARGTQLPVAVLHQERSRSEDDLVVVRMKDWLELVEPVLTEHYRHWPVR